MRVRLRRSSKESGLRVVSLNVVGMIFVLDAKSFAPFFFSSTRK